MSVSAKLRRERGVFLRVGEAIDVERSDVFVGGVERVTEDAFEMRIGGGCGAANLTDVEAGADVLKQIGDDLFALLHRQRGRCLGLIFRRPLLFDGGANGHGIGAGVEHEHRVTRDVYANRSTIAVSVPLGDVALCVAALHEAGFVVRMPAALAAAVAGHELENLGMLRREPVDGPGLVNRASR